MNKNKLIYGVTIKTLRFSMVFFIVILMVFSNVLFAQNYSGGTKNYKALNDSIFNSFNLEDVGQIKSSFERKQERTAKYLKKLNEASLKVDTTIINRKSNTVVGQDAILVRLAEFYYDEAEEEYFTRSKVYDRKLQEYDSLLSLYDNNQISEMPREPKLPESDYTKPISIYRRIVDEFPNGTFADAAMYNIAFLVGKMGDGQKSRRALQELIDKYPDSEYAPDAYLTLGDYFFNPRDEKNIEESIVELQKAIKLYKKILKYDDSKAYSEALYKLGWSYYKLTARDSTLFNDAIWYFWRAVEDIYLGKKYDPEEDITLANVQPEAIKYIAISFSDIRYSGKGINNTQKFIQNIENKLGERDYNVLILRDLGDVYFEREDRVNAVYAYETLLEMYPLYDDAPLISKKIVDTYSQEGKDQNAYTERTRLYSNYNPNTEWFKKIEDSESNAKFDKMKQAYKLSEEALRSNIAYDYHAIEEIYGDSSGIGFYTKVADEIHQYLEIFPVDSQAYQLNWQLALILDQKERKLVDAFDEYIKVCNDYYEVEHQEQAAINAIAVAQELAGITSQDTTKRSFEGEALKARQLNEDQQRLIYSYDNYLRHFPDGTYAPSALAAAGALYFNNNQFSQAKVYLQTLVQKFPGAKERNLAYKSIMESYFALGKYRDAEAVAVKIINSPGTSEDMKEDARKRAAASIFKNGEKLSRDKNFIESGYEYRRLAETYPTSEFADRALLNGAQAFENGNAWKLGIETYGILINNYPNSEYKKAAYKNIAEDYKELDDNIAVAESYEKLYHAYPTDEDAEANLYNASLYYEKGEGWMSAIAINTLFVSTFPNSVESDFLLFNNANFYLKLDRLEDANQIYDQYARKYPDSPRTVEAFYKRGEYYFDSSTMELATTEFLKAIDKSDQLKRIGKDPNAFYAGEAVYKLVEIQRQSFDDITFTSTNFDSQKEQKMVLLKKLTKNYQRVISYGSVRGFESFYRIPEMYEVIGNDIKEMELPPNLPADQVLMKNRENRANAAALYNKAVDEYKSVLILIPQYGNKLGLDILETDMGTATQQDLATVDTTLSQKMALEDSTKKVGKQWYMRTESKISNLLYNMAETHTENLEEVIGAGYAQADSKASGPLNVFFKTTIITKGAIPSAQKAIEAHEKNVNTAVEMNLDNKYVEESKRQILLVSNRPAYEMGKLYREAIDGHIESEEKVKDLAEKGEGATDGAGKNVYDYSEQSKLFLDYARQLAELTLNQYINTIDLAKTDSIKNDYLRSTKNKVFEFAYKEGIKAFNYSAEYDIASKEFITKFDSSDFNYTYEDVGYYFEDIKFSMEEIYRTLLETGYNYSEEYEVSNIWTKRILAQLVMIDPSTYASQIPKEKFEVFSGPAFKAVDEYMEGWTASDFDDSGWAQAVIIDQFDDSTQFALFNEIGTTPKAIWAQPKGPDMKEILVPDTVWNTAIDPVAGDAPVEADSSSAFLEGMVGELDSAAVGDSPGYTINYITEYIPIVVDTVDTMSTFFRTDFEVDGQVTSAMIYVTGDEDFQLFLNGEWIWDDEFNDYSAVDSIDYYTIGDYIKTGRNVIGIKLTDYDSAPRLGLRFYFVMEYIPGSLQEQLAKEEEIPEVYVEPEKLHRVMLVNKGRLTPLK